VKEGSEYVLEAADNATYQLDEGGMDKFEDKKVRIIGNLNPASHKIHVLTIEPMS
jgi:hypothetical protein